MTTERERLFTALEAMGGHRDVYRKHSTKALRRAVQIRERLIAFEMHEALDDYGARYVVAPDGSYTRVYDGGEK